MVSVKNYLALCNNTHLPCVFGKHVSLKYTHLGISPQCSHLQIHTIFWLILNCDTLVKRLFTTYMVEMVFTQTHTSIHKTPTKKQFS